MTDKPYDPELQEIIDAAPTASPPVPPELLEWLKSQQGPQPEAATADIHPDDIDAAEASIGHLGIAGDYEYSGQELAARAVLAAVLPAHDQRLREIAHAEGYAQAKAEWSEMDTEWNKQSYKQGYRDALNEAADEAQSWGLGGFAYHLRALAERARDAMAGNMPPLETSADWYRAPTGNGDNDE